MLKNKCLKLKLALVERLVSDKQELIIKDTLHNVHVHTVDFHLAVG